MGENADDMEDTRLGIIHDTAYDEGYQAGYAAAKAEMLSKLDTFNPVYVEGGRVPDDAIVHRNGPEFKDSIVKKGANDDAR